MTDSASVFRWLKSMIERTHKIRTRALGKMLIRRRLDMIAELIEQEKLKISVKQVESARNKADQLTRVPKKWLAVSHQDQVGVSMVAVANHLEQKSLQEELTCIHERHHFGVDRTLEIARLKFGENVSRRMVRSVVSQCRECSSIDPAVRFRWEKGSIVSNAVWQRMAVDVAHVNGRPYLTCIDCCSRFTIWRVLKDESAKEIKLQLIQIFAEMGPVEEILSDNGGVFHGFELQQFYKEWDIKSDFSCAYRSKGNGLIERIHRTIKRMVARSGRSVEEMTFWYNATKGERIASPYEMMFVAKSRMPGVTEKRQEIRRIQPDANVSSVVGDIYGKMHVVTRLGAGLIE